MRSKIVHKMADILGSISIVSGLLAAVLAFVGLIPSLVSALILAFGTGMYMGFSVIAEKCESDEAKVAERDKESKGSSAASSVNETSCFGDSMGNRYHLGAIDINCLLCSDEASYEDTVFIPETCSIIKEQVSRFNNKIKETGTIFKHLSEHEVAVLRSIYRLFENSVRILAKYLHLFDEKEYVAFRRGNRNLSHEENQEKLDLYNKKIVKIKELTKRNESLILALDKLIHLFTLKYIDDSKDADTIVMMRSIESSLKSMQEVQNMSDEVDDEVYDYALNARNKELKSL